MSDKAKKVLNAVTNILMVLVILFALLISITSITAKGNGGVPDLFGRTAFSIQTDSMNPTLKAGDYIFGEKCDPDTLQIGDIITYFTIIDNKKVVNTHRIVEIVDNGTYKYFRTQGDNVKTNTEVDERPVEYGDVISKYNGTRIPVLGSVLDWMSTSLGFFLVIVFPVLVYTIYQIYKLIVVILHNQKVKLAESEDEIKKAAIAEYLAKQEQQENTEKTENTEKDTNTEEQ